MFKTYTEVLAQFITKRQRLHTPRLSRILNLQTMLVCSGDEVNFAIRTGKFCVPRKYVCYDKRVQMSNMGS